MNPQDFLKLSPQEQADIWSTLKADDRQSIREAQKPNRGAAPERSNDLFDPETRKPKDLLYVSAELEIPDKEPYEGKATLKQKQRIWELGYKDQSVIDGLGKKQASSLIDQLSRVYMKGIGRRSSRRYFVWALIFIAGAIAVPFLTQNDAVQTTVPLFGFLTSTTLFLLGIFQWIRTPSDGR